MGLCEGLSPEARALDLGNCSRVSVLSGWARLVALGRAVRKFRPRRAAGCDRAHVHSSAGMADGTTEDQSLECTRSGAWYSRCGRADRRRVERERLEPGGTAGCVAGIVLMGCRGGSFASA